MIRYLAPLLLVASFLPAARANVLELQHQPTFPFVGIGWRYEPPAYPPAEEIIAAPATERPVYGLYCWGGEYVEYNEQIHDIGWTNFRFSGPMADEHMRAYASDGVEVMATLAARLYGSFKPEAPMSDWRNRANYESDQAFIEDYVSGVIRWLERWGPEGSFFAENPDIPHNPIRAIEVFNEPNFWYLDTARSEHLGWKGMSESERLAIEAKREALYAKLLTATHTAVKERWPEIKIVGFAAGGSAMADVRFIENVHAADPKVSQSYDVLSTHPYVTRPCAPEGIVMKNWGEYSINGNLEQIRASMERHGATQQPIWYTEQGWAVNLRSGGSFVDAIRPPDDGYDEKAVSLGTIPYDIDPRKWVDPLTHAAYIVRMYAQCLRMGVERHFFMSIVDTDGFNSGFLQKDGTPRQAAVATKTMIETMPHPKLLEVISDGEGGLFIYRFDPDAKNPHDQSVIMAWGVQLNLHSLPVFDMEGALFDSSKGSVKAMTMLGEQITVEPTGAPLSIQLGPVPIYLGGALSN